MLDTHLAPHATCRRLRAGPAADHIDDFADWLHRRGYRPAVLRNKLRSFAAWTDWLKLIGMTGTDFISGLRECESYIGMRSRARYQRGPNKESLTVARLFIRFLQQRNVLPQPLTPPSPADLWPLLGEFRSWMRQHRGVTESTLRVYDGSLAEFQATVGADPAAYTAESVRRFVLERARRHGVSYAKLTASAVRTFLQFLAATGRCRTGLAHAIPAFASWNNTSMPRFLIPEDLERVVASCTGEAIGLRDKAILLLLARLGLRAGDVVRLTLKDLDWRNGTLVVCGKGRRHDLLPIPQEVGDAIKDYLERGRPSSQVPEVFTRTFAPVGPLAPQAISHTVRRALRRARVEAPTQGAHLLRHSAATSMLRQGASLAGIGAVFAIAPRKRQPTMLKWTWFSCRRSPSRGRG
jgi:site-specific recombinase XerD